MLSVEFLPVTFTTTPTFVNWFHHILLSNKTLTDNILNLRLYAFCVYISLKYILYTMQMYLFCCFLSYRKQYTCVFKFIHVQACIMRNKSLNIVTYIFYWSNLLLNSVLKEAHFTFTKNVTQNSFEDSY